MKVLGRGSVSGSRLADERNTVDMHPPQLSTVPPTTLFQIG
jgi:hypothetical protein